jgi:nicotinamidase-related amidase
MGEPVWNGFLTSQDRKLLAATGPAAIYGFGQRPAVLSVDNYRAGVGDRPEPLLEAIRTWPNSTGLAGWAALEQIAALLAAARVADIPVIHTTGLGYEESGIPGWRAGGANRTSRDAMDDTYRRRYEFVEQAAPLTSEVRIKKNAPSAFFGTALLGYLIGNNIDTLIVCGQTASGCVRATVVDGCAYRFHMIVVEECVYDRYESARAVNLFDIDQKYGDVVSLEDATTWLKGNIGR